MIDKKKMEREREREKARDIINCTNHFYFKFFSPLIFKSKGHVIQKIVPLPNEQYSEKQGQERNGK